MHIYQAGVFSELAKTHLGQELWGFLNREEIVAGLVTASRLGKPAVEGVAEQLLAQFKQEVLANRVKQMIGHMVRQIMERLGWILDQSEVKVSSVPFIKAARYRRPDWQTFHAFRNTADPRDVAISATRQTGHLPANVRWSYYLTFESPLQAAMAFSLRNLEQVRREVEQNGFLRISVPRLLRRG